MSRLPLISLHTVPCKLSASSPHLPNPVTATRCASITKSAAIGVPRRRGTKAATLPLGIQPAGDGVVHSSGASLVGCSRAGHVVRPVRCLNGAAAAAAAAGRDMSSATGDRGSGNLIRDVSIPVPAHVVAGLFGRCSRPEGSQGTIGIDIGGTLTKVIFFDSSSQSPSSSSIVEANLPHLRCQVWPTRALEECLSSIRARFESAGRDWLRVSATGGGAMKFASQLSTLAGHLGDPLQDRAANENAFDSQDEMACLAAGLNYLRRAVDEEFYSFDSADMYPTKDTMALPREPVSQCHAVQFQSGENEMRPTLLANIGTGASFVLCPSQKRQLDSPADVEPARRIGGTPLSGSTLMGMVRLLTGKQTYSEMLELASQGDSRKVDLTVANVYGTDYNSVGLSGHRAAGFLGQVAAGEPSQSGEHSHADIARSLVFAISYNIGQQAVLQARANDAAREICFAGSFASGHPLVMGAIDYAVNANGGGKFVATFLRHESFLGAIGAWAIGAAGRE